MLTSTVVCFFSLLLSLARLSLWVDPNFEFRTPNFVDALCGSSFGLRALFFPSVFMLRCTLVYFPPCFWSGAYRLLQGSLGNGCSALTTTLVVRSQHGLLAPLQCLVLLSTVNPSGFHLAVDGWILGSTSRDGLTLLGSSSRVEVAGFLVPLCCPPPPSPRVGNSCKISQRCRRVGHAVPLVRGSLPCNLGVSRGSFRCVESHACDARHVGTWRPCRIRRSQQPWPRVDKPRPVCNYDALPLRAVSCCTLFFVVVRVLSLFVCVPVWTFKGLALYPHWHFIDWLRAKFASK